jgi:hypothetical protein
LALRAVRAGFRDVAAVAALAALAALFWARILGGDALDYRDFAFFFVPLRHAFAQVLRSGAAPLWNPFFGGGIPLAADPNASVFFPPTLLFAAMPLSAGARLATGAWAVAFPLLSYAGLRGLGRSRFASFAAAGGLAISGPAMALAGYLTTGWALAFFFPLTAALASRRRGSVLPAGLLFGLVLLAGEPAVGLIALAGAALISLDRPVTAFLRRLAVTVGIGVAVALPQVVAALGLIARTVRSEALHVAGAAAYYSVRPLRLFAVLWPGLFGDPLSPLPDGFWGGRFFDAGGAYVASLAVGTATLVASVAALALPRGRRWLAVAALSALVSFGRYLPGGEAVLGLPGISILRYPEKWLFLTTLALFGAAAIGLDEIARDRDSRSWAVGAGLLFMALSGLALAAARLFPMALLAVLSRARVVSTTAGGDVVALALAREFAGVAMFALLSTVVVALPRLRRRAPPILALLLLAELFPRTWNWLPTVPASALDRPPQVAESVRKLGGRLYFDVEREVAGDPLRPFFPVRWDVALAGNNDIDRFSPRRSFFFGLDLTRKTFSDPAKARLLRLADVHVISTIDPAAATIAGARMIARTSAVRTVYALDGGRRFRLLNAAEVAKDETESRARLLSPGFDPERIAILEGGDALLPVSPGDCQGTVRPLRLRAGAETVEVEAPGRCVLVRSETFDPHWRAEIDGAPGLVVPADFAFQGVVVPAGRHVVSFRYRDRATVVAMIVSLATLVGCAGVLRRQRGDGKSRPAYPVSST